MTHSGQKEDESTIKKYIALMSVISRIENRLMFSEFVYLSLNVIILLFIFGFVSFLADRNDYVLSFIEIAFTFFCIIIGMAISTYWVASSMRSQLKLKLHYFQARYMERKMNCEGECIYSDESIFFDPDINIMESPDDKETLRYPTSGASRMDGFIGSSKPRYFSWLMPCLFIFIYWAIFFLVLSYI